jgi:hypothetical protein
MIQIGNTLLSLDIIEKEFMCDVRKCKGACCVRGDSGAPLEEDEINRLKSEYRKIKPFLREEGRGAIRKTGIYVIDSDGDRVTPLIDGKECSYAIFEDGIARCGIEKAYMEGKSNFWKPVSCHLYPIRLKKYKDFEAMNYDKWEICEPARTLGSNEKIPVFRFVKPALTRKYGVEWVRTLEVAAKEWALQKNNR